MNNAYLIRMANDIGNFFATESDTAAAVQSIAQHLERFWDPRMRRQIIAHCEKGGAGLGDRVRAAVGTLAKAAADRDNAART